MKNKSSSTPLIIRILRKWRLILGFVIIIVFGGFLFFANSTSNGTVLPAPPPPPGAETITTQQIEGTYLTFTAPPSFSVKEHNIDQPPALERFTLRSDDGKGSREITMSIEPLRATEMQNIPGVSLRRSQNKVYTEKILSAAGSAINRVRFNRTDKDGKENTLFWIADQHLVTMSVTSSAIGAEIDTDFQIVLDGLNVVDQTQSTN